MGIQAEIEIVRELWREYWGSLGLAGEFQNFEEEVASLPGVYCRLLVERVEGEAAGTVALRPLGEGACEMKRLYVRPGYRGRGLARKLVEDALGEARGMGYREVFCVTLPSMGAALGLYRSMGFGETGAYSEDATPGAIFLRRAV